MCLCKIRSEKIIRNNILKIYLLRAEAKLYSTFLFMRHLEKNKDTFSIAKFYLLFFFKERKLQPNIFSHFHVSIALLWLQNPEDVQELHLLGNNSSLQNLGPILWSQLYLCKVCKRIRSQGRANGSWEICCCPLFLGFLGLWENLAERFLAQNS